MTDNTLARTNQGEAVPLASKDDPGAAMLLYLGSNPPGSANIQVYNEKKCVENVKPPDTARRIRVHAELLVQTEDLLPLFNGTKLDGQTVDILHIAAHGTKQGKLVFADEHGRELHLAGAALADVLRVTNTHLKLLVCNACYSKAFADHLLEFVDCVVATKDSIGTANALKFACLFYQQLIGKAATIRSAYDTALAGLGAAAGEPVPHLYLCQPTRPGADRAAPLAPPQLVTDSVFVIQAVGEVKSSTRDRADRIYDTLIFPVCDKLGMMPKRAHETASTTVREPIVNSLHTARLVIADLGKKPWSPDVLLEIGYRLANGRPVVIIVDVPKTNLPVFIQPIKVVQSTDSVEYVYQMCQQALMDPRGWESHYPTVEIAVYDNNLRTAEYVYANEEGAKFFGYDAAKDLVGQKVSAADKNVMAWMPREHAKQFDIEQGELFRNYLISGQGVAPVAVRHPVWFIDHKFKEFKDEKYYWPVLTQKRHAKEDNIALLRVAFIPICTWMNEPPERFWGEYVAELPYSFKSHEQYRDDILIVYDASKQATNMALVGFLHNAECELRVRSLVATDEQIAAIESQVHRAKLVLLVLGEKGVPTKVQEAMVAELDVANQKPVIILYEGEWESLREHIGDLCRLVDRKRYLYLSVTLEPNRMGRDSTIARTLVTVVRLLHQELIRV